MAKSFSKSVLLGGASAGVFGIVGAAVLGGGALLFGGPVAILAAVGAAGAGYLGTLIGLVTAGTDVGPDGRPRYWEGVTYKSGLTALAGVSALAFVAGNQFFPKADTSVSSEFNYRCTGTERPTVVATDNGHRLVVPKSCTPV